MNIARADQVLFMHVLHKVNKLNIQLMVRVVKFSNIWWVWNCTRIQRCYFGDICIFWISSCQWTNLPYRFGRNCIELFHDLYFVWSFDSQFQKPKLRFQFQFQFTLVMQCNTIHAVTYNIYLPCHTLRSFLSKLTITINQVIIDKLSVDSGYAFCLNCHNHWFLKISSVADHGSKFKPVLFENRNRLILWWRLVDSNCGTVMNSKTLN